MSRRLWFYCLAALLLVLGGISSAANAALPGAAGPNLTTASAPAAAPPEAVDCSQIAAHHLDMQMNLHAAAILAACGQAKPAAAAARGARGAGASLGGPLSPANYGGTDVDVILPDNTGTHITQSETFVWFKDALHGVAAYNDSRTAPACYSGGSYTTDGGVTWTMLASRPFCAGHGTGL